MNTFEGRGGYVYEILPDGGFKIIKSPQSAGGQVIAKGGKYWDLVKKEQDELAGFVDRADHKQNAGRETSARSGLADARASAASAASKVDTSPMAMAMEKAKSSPGGTTSGMNKPMTEADIRFKPSVDHVELGEGNWAGKGGKDRPMTPSERTSAQAKIDSPSGVAGKDRPFTAAERTASQAAIDAKRSGTDTTGKDFPAGMHVERISIGSDGEVAGDERQVEINRKSTNATATRR